MIRKRKYFFELFYPQLRIIKLLPECTRRTSQQQSTNSTPIENGNCFIRLIVVDEVNQRSNHWLWRNQDQRYTIFVSL
jgi:hypothetical protein